MNKELRSKTNEELCALIVRLKLQLLESRFRMASGELEKLHTLPEIRKTIARAMTILNERSIKLSIGTHGVTMYNTKTNEVKSITNVIESSLKAETAKSDGIQSNSDAIKEATAAAVKAMPNSTSSVIPPKKTPVAKKPASKSVKTTKKPNATTIRKNVQGA